MILEYNEGSKKNKIEVSDGEVVGVVIRFIYDEYMADTCLATTAEYSSTVLKGLYEFVEDYFGPDKFQELVDIYKNKLVNYFKNKK